MFLWDFFGRAGSTYRQGYIRGLHVEITQLISLLSFTSYKITSQKNHTMYTYVYTYIYIYMKPKRYFFLILVYFCFSSLPFFNIFS